LDVGDTVITELVWPLITESDEHVDELPEYQTYEKVVVPPVGLAVSVIDWPLSIGGVDGVTAPATSVGLTTTFADDVELSPRLSVSFSVTV
jgi:hypothetical protein